jgi:beta-lactamase regulating signal transducer with metallopeptidase domain
MINKAIYKEKQKTFYQIILFGLVFLSLVGFLIINSFSYLEPKIEAIGNMCGCTTIINSVQINQSNNYLAIVFITVLAIFVLFVVYKIAKLLFNTIKFTKSFLKHKTITNSEILQKISKLLNIENKVTQITHGEPIVFCHNFIRPKICISQKLLDKLTEKELQAVLLHEKSHLQSSEPIKIFLIKSALSLMFFIPIIKILADKYFTLAEISADEYVVENFHKTYLASALCKLIDLNKNSLLQKNVALSFFSVLGSRVEYLSEQSTFNKKTVLPFKTVLGSTLIFVFVLSFSWITYSNEPLDDDSDDQNCRILQQEQKCPSESKPKYAPDYTLDNE